MKMQDRKSRIGYVKMTAVSGSTEFTGGTVKEMILVTLLAFIR